MSDSDRENVCVSVYKEGIEEYKQKMVIIQL